MAYNIKNTTCLPTISKDEPKLYATDDTFGTIQYAIIQLNKIKRIRGGKKVKEQEQIKKASSYSLQWLFPSPLT